VSRRNLVFLGAALLMAALFARLGVWQLHRLAERRARNALVTARLRAAPVPLGALPRDSTLARYRRVHVAGTFDFAHEVVYVGRIRDGSPGVQLVTPLRPDSAMLGDTLLLVDRGWVYSPDGASVDLARWHEPAHIDATGYVQEFSAVRAYPAQVPGRPGRMRWLDPAAASRAIGAPVAGYFVVLDPDGGRGGGGGAVATPNVPVRIPTPALDEGPHLNYAIQWFSFAVIAVVGALAAVFGRSQRVPPRRDA
jgi:surfeit locus 1 family protein